MCRKIRCDGYCANFFGLHGQLNRPWIEKVICGGHACTLITAESWQTGANHATGKRWMDRLYSITTHECVRMAFAERCLPSIFSTQITPLQHARSAALLLYTTPWSISFISPLFAWISWNYINPYKPEAMPVRSVRPHHPEFTHRIRVARCPFHWSTSTCLPSLSL
jgi:hypothetical protein